MTVLFSVLSIISMVVQNCLFNSASKKTLTSSKHIYKYNFFVYLVCVFIFGAFLFGENISFYTVALGTVFGIITALSNFYKMNALSTGPMHITLLVITSSMIIPTMSGVFFGERFSVAKLILAVVLIGFIYLSMDTSSEQKANTRWFIYCVIAFILQGSIGVLQKVHQSSEHKAEINAFLFAAFICSAIYSTIRSGNGMKNIKFSRSTVVFAIICGVCTYAMNYINLKLSGILPSQLFFPLINGSAIVLSSAMSVILFKEKLSRKQLVGLVGGIATLIGICIVK